MERSPDDDTTKRTTQREQAANDRAAQRDAAQAPRGPAQQQQSPRAREFAPGEDGECH